MVLVDSVHPAEWKEPTPEQLRMIEAGLRYAWIAAWLARLGFVRFASLGWHGVYPGWDGRRQARSASAWLQRYNGLRERFASCRHRSYRLCVRCGRSRKIS